MTTTTEAPQVATLRPPVEFARMERSGLATWWSDTCVFARRNIEHIRQIPEKLLDVTLQPLMFVLLFAYVFGGAIAVQGGNYREYIIGGILVQSLAFGLTGPATAISTDLTEGVIDRFRSLPATRTAYLSGHFLAELAGMCLSIVVLLTAGLVVGWRVHTDVFHVATALVLLLTFASAMIWIGTWIGLKVRSADAVMGIAFTVVFPLTFLSSAFVPIESLPTGLQWIAIWNPITVMIGAVRELFGNPLTPVTRHAWPMDHADPVRVRLLRAAARDRGAGLDPALPRAHERLTGSVRREARRDDGGDVVGVRHRRDLAGDASCRIGEAHLVHERAERGRDRLRSRVLRVDLDRGARAVAGDRVAELVGRLREADLRQSATQGRQERPGTRVGDDVRGVREHGVLRHVLRHPHAVGERTEHRRVGAGTDRHERAAVEVGDGRDRGAERLGRGVEHGAEGHVDERPVPLACDPLDVRTYSRFLDRGRPHWLRVRDVVDVARVQARRIDVDEEVVVRSRARLGSSPSPRQ